MYTVFGDPHAKLDNLEKINWLFDIAEELGNPVIWLGDMLDTKEVVRSKCLNLIYTRLRDSKLHHTILVGNHDYHNLECKDHSLEPLKALPNAVIVDKPFVRGQTGFLPYYHDLEKFYEGLTEMIQCGVKYLFMHQGVTGMDYGNGFLEQDGVPIAAFVGQFEKVISGHFHTYQTLANLTYLGTPFTHQFGETSNVKYIGMFDETTGNLEAVETTFPRHTTGHINCDLLLSKDVPNLLKNIFNENDYVRVVLEGTEEAVRNAAKFIKLLHPDYKLIEKPTLQDANIAISETEDNISKFVSWANEIKHLDKDTVDLGVSILKGVQ